MAEAKKYTHLERAQAKAIYNFKQRQETAKRETELKEQLDNGTFFESQLAQTKPAKAEPQTGGETYEPELNKKGK